VACWLGAMGIPQAFDSGLASGALRVGGVWHGKGNGLVVAVRCEKTLAVISFSTPN
jgi:hypothetical protein